MFVDTLPHQRDLVRRRRPALQSRQFYYVGGNSKFYGAVMFRYRERDFEAHRTAEGATRRGPSRYAELEPWYGEPSTCSTCTARRATIRPSRPAPSLIRIRRFRTSRSSAKLRTHARARPASLSHAARRSTSIPAEPCVRCGTCDAFPARVGAKGDAETRVDRPGAEASET